MNLYMNGSKKSSQNARKKFENENNLDNVDGHL
jgi:hypothetical protein